MICGTHPSCSLTTLSFVCLCLLSFLFFLSSNCEQTKTQNKTQKQNSKHSEMLNNLVLNLKVFVFLDRMFGDGNCQSHPLLQKNHRLSYLLAVRCCTCRSRPWITPPRRWASAWDSYLSAGIKFVPLCLVLGSLLQCICTDLNDAAAGVDFESLASHVGSDCCHVAAAG